jgi:flagellar L-ring protein precursor FlgH
LVLVALVWTTVASAQQQPASRGQNGPAPTRPSETPPAQPAKPLNNNDARVAASAMQRNGGSLLKATLATPTDPGQAQLSNVSYFSVPEPEPRVIKKHDQVTIIIREESEFTSEGNTETKKDAKLDARVTEFIKIDLEDFAIRGGNVSEPPPAIAAEGTREFTGEGTVDRTDTFTARITARVLDVKPNGTLVLQARKRIKTDEEEQSLVLTGICRAEDITADNSILSTQLYDLELAKNHKGTVRDATRKGWGGKLLDALSPF